MLTWGTIRVVEIFTIPNGLPVASGKATAIDALKKTFLEYTAVVNGFFVDYYVQPHVKSYLSGLTLAIDTPNKTAAIPGSGNTPVVFTHTFDVAKFVDPLLRLTSWETESYIIGDKVTMNDFLAIAEEARGTKFATTYDSLEKLKRHQVTELPGHIAVYPFFPKQMLQAMCAVFGILFDQGFLDLRPTKTLNDLFPEVQTRSVRDLVNEAWKGR